MQYTTEVTINAPRERVVEYFEKPEHIKGWQPTLKKMDHVSGEPGQSGAQTNLIYQEGKRRMVMLETIMENNLPESFTATYEMGGVYNVQKNRFYAEGDQTRWVSDSEFQFSGFMKVIGFLMRGAFPKQTRKTMEQFKAFVESQ